MDGTRTLVFILALSNVIDAAKVSNCTNGVISLTCPTTSGCVLKICSSTFGHGETRENCSVELDDCQTNASFVWGLCEGRSRCNIQVPQERPRQDCKTVSSYLTVEFECVCVRCRPLPVVPANLGRVSYSSPYLTANTTAIYTCRHGYLLTGPRVRTCLPDGTWSGLQPACSVPVTVCPPSVYQRSAYGSRCYEFVSSVATWQEAQTDCSGRNGSLLALGSSMELAYLGWQLDKLQVYNYVWLANTNTETGVGTLPGNSSKTTGDAAPATCLELYRPEAADATWQRRNATCTYMNAYLCAYEIEPSWIESIASTRKYRSTKAGIGIGIGVGIILILVGLFCILCRDRKDEEEGLPEKTNPEADKDGTHLDSEMDIYDDTTYDDTLPECDVTPSPSPDIAKYAQVDRRKKTNGHHLPQQPPSDTPVHQQPNYDQVYASMSGMDTNSRPTHHRHHGSNNTYENVTVHNLVGSLKKKLTRPWRSSGSRRVTPEPTPASMGGTVPRVMAPSGGGTTAPGGSNSPVVVVVRRDKPRPAPKPAVRRSALEAKLEAIRAGRAAAHGEVSAEVNGRVRAPSPDVEPPSATAPSSSIRREGTAGRSNKMAGSLQSGGQNITSGIEIVENEIYDSDDNHGKLTEL